SRKVFTTKQQHKFLKAMEKIAEDNSLRTENNYTPEEVLNNYGKTVVNEFTKSYIIDNKSLRSHEEGNIYIHDRKLFPLGVLSDTHLGISKIENFNKIIFNILKMKNEVQGEINIPKIDYLLEPYLMNNYKQILKEKVLSYLKVSGFSKYINFKKVSEIIDKNQEFDFIKEEYEQFILSKNVDYIFKQAFEDAFIKTEEIFIKELSEFLKILDNEKKYSISLGTSSSPAGKLINELILKTLNKINKLENLKIIFKLTKNNQSYHESVIKLLLKEKRVIISFIDNSYNKDECEVEYFSEGIRIFENINSNKRNSSGRMIVAKTSVNMSRLGLKYQQKPVKDFYKELEEILEIIKNNLLLSFETIGNKNKNNYETLFKNNILDDEKLETSGKIRKVIKNGVLLIGVVGLTEGVISLEKDKSKQYKLMIDILKFLNKKITEFENDTKLNFAIYEPEDELVRKEFMALDKAVYGINKNVTEDSKYDLISNFSSIKNDYLKQAEIQRLFSGGNSLEIILPDKTSCKKILYLINELAKKDISFAKIKLGKKVD
ncbi:MAG: anaerobic ribonucleoside-triphosphate reductase, partial [Bacilli bacterium]|nr:anaerobic ribonucleoside-triphosphate reductase [Bacilli bacterium]